MFFFNLNINFNINFEKENQISYTHSIDWRIKVLSYPNFVQKTNIKMVLRILNLIKQKIPLAKSKLRHLYKSCIYFLKSIYKYLMKNLLIFFVLVKFSNLKYLFISICIFYE